MRGLEESLQLRLAVFPAHVLIDVLPDDLPSLARRVLAKLRDLIHGFLAVRRDARVDRGLHGSIPFRIDATNFSKSGAADSGS